MSNQPLADPLYQQILVSKKQCKLKRYFSNRINACLHKIENATCLCTDKVSFRVNEYEEADRQLGNAFSQPASQALKRKAEELEPEDTERAVRFVGLIEETVPINIDGLSQLIARREKLISQEAKGLLDAQDFLQVCFLTAYQSLLCVRRSENQDAN